MNFILILLLFIGSALHFHVAARLSRETCDTTDDTLYIVVDSTSDVDLTFTRIKNFLQFFISKKEKSSKTTISVIEPFNGKVVTFLHFNSNQEISVNLDQFKTTIKCNTSHYNNISKLNEAVSFLDKHLNNSNSTDAFQSVIIAWFSVCYVSCHETVGFLQTLMSKHVARQMFLFLPLPIKVSRNLLESYLSSDTFIYIPLVHHDDLSDNNVIALYICNECPLGWIDVRGEDENSKLICYRVIISPFQLHWNDASKQCKHLFSELPIIDSNEELQILTSTLKKANNGELLKANISKIVHVGLIKSRISRKRLKWANGQPFLLKKNVINEGDNKQCGVLNISVSTELTNESVSRRSDQISWQMIDCMQEITEVLVCSKFLANRNHKMSYNVVPEIKTFAKKVMSYGKEFILDVGDLKMKSVANMHFTDIFTNNIENKQMMFDCDVGEAFLPYSRVCNTFSDCYNDKDERVCGYPENCDHKQSSYCKNPNANELFPVKFEYDLEEKCNNVQDCPDNSDEEECDECTERRCSDGTCVPSHWLSRNGDKCRLFNDSNGFIYLKITLDVYFSIESIHQVVTCKLLEVMASNLTLTNYTENDTWASKCILFKGRSGRPTGCNDLSHLHDCVDVNCSGEFVKCPQSYCIPLYYINDGVMDCPHGEDEIQNTIESMSCPFLCNHMGNTKCIHYVNVCDGVAHCPEGDDELNCNVTCPRGFKCIASATMVKNISGIIEIKSFRIFDIQTKYLNVNGVDLSDLKEIYILPHLLELHASNCNLRSLDKVFSDSLMLSIFKLDLSYNKFIEIVLNDNRHSSFSSLVFLNLSYNSNLSFLIGNLKETNVDISYTNITYLDIKYNMYSKSLSYLNTSNTNIKSLGTIIGTLSLEVLDIRNTSLIEMDTFEFFRKLNITEALYTDNFKYCCPQLVGMGIPKHVCHAPFDGISSCEDLIGDIMQRSIFWLVALFSLGGNLLNVSLRIFCDREFLNNANWIFVTNLGISDFVMGVYLTCIVAVDVYCRDIYVLYEVDWRASMFRKIVDFLFTLSSDTSNIFVLLVKLDVFFLIFYKKVEFTHKRLVSITLVIISWIIGLTLAALPLTTSEWNISSSNGMCNGLPYTSYLKLEWQYGIEVFLIILNFIFVIAITLCLFFVCLRFSYETLMRKSDNISIRKHEFDKRLLIIALTKIICLLPVCVDGLLALVRRTLGPENHAWIYIIASPLNAAINPMIYVSPFLYRKWMEFKKGRNF